MTKQQMLIWFRIVTVILILFGLLYIFFGLKIFSNNTPLIPKNVILDWESALYGAIMIGWGVTLLLAGRLAFKRDDNELKKILFLGIAVWLVFEAATSAWLGVWFNVGVDAAVLTLFAIPLRLDSKK